MRADKDTQKADGDAPKFFDPKMDGLKFRPYYSILNYINHYTTLNVSNWLVYS